MLKFVGTGSAFNTARGNNSAYILEGDTLILIDCGATTFDRLKSSGILDNVVNIHIYITHTHDDHVGSLGSLILYHYYNVGTHLDGIINLEIMAHPKVKISKYLRKCGVEKDVHYCLLEVEDGICTDIGETEYNFITFKTEHVDNLFSTGLIIGSGNDMNVQTCIYTGDTKYLNSSVVEILNMEHDSTLYVDTSSEKYENSVHLSLEELTEIIPENLRHKVWCMHLDEKFNEEYAKSLGFNIAESDLNL